MSGDVPQVIVIEGDPGGTIKAFVRAIASLPSEPYWVLVGGFAVNLRIAAIHRSTGDLDTVTNAPQRLIELITDQPEAEKIDRAKVVVEAGMKVKIDVMPSTVGEALPPGGWKRGFAHARRWAIDSAEPVSITVVDGDGSPVAHGACFLATVHTLIALKVVALRGRQGRSSKTKVGSDIHDLVRLTVRHPIGELAEGFASAPGELTDYVAQQLTRLFDPDEDGPISLRRLQVFSGGNVDVVSITLEDLAFLAELGRTLGQ